jgi:hypothetical protein
MMVIVMMRMRMGMMMIIIMKGLQTLVAAVMMHTAVVLRP